MGWGRANQSASSVAQRLEPFVQRGQRLGVGDVGHRHLVDEGAFLVDVERRRQVEDGLAVLDGHHPPGRERAAVADAVDLVEDGHVGIAGAQEVGVQRVHAAALDGASRRHEGLGRHLARRRPAGGARRGSRPGRC